MQKITDLLIDHAPQLYFVERKEGLRGRCLHHHQMQDHTVIRKQEKPEAYICCYGGEMADEDWCVAVFKCKPEDLRKVLVEFYSFVQNLKDVKSLHFLIRDRLGDKVVFSFRMMVDSKDKLVIGSKVAYKLGTLLPEKDFAVNPEGKNPLTKYVSWNPEERIAKAGPQKFLQFCKVLERMSELALWMIKKKYFSSDERVETAHVMSWMLGCTEYGLLDTKHWEVGYYDRVEDRYCRYLTQEFPRK